MNYMEKPFPLHEVTFRLDLAAEYVFLAQRIVEAVRSEKQNLFAATA